MKTRKILIDADGCPVVDICLDVARQYDLKPVIICDTSHYFNDKNAEIVMVDKGADAVDFELINRVGKFDIVVTQDYGLAAMVLSKKAYAINQNGLVYSNDNIDQLLLTRHLAKKLKNAGIKTKGPRKREKEDDIRFQKALIQLICATQESFE